MIYKKYEFSLSLNGTKIMHIARNAAGVVVFRAESENELKNLIDLSIQDIEQKAVAEQNKKAKLEERKKKGLLEQESDQKEEVAESLTPPQTRVTRGSDGKFISKSVLDTEEEKKKGFWEKLTS